MRVVCKSPAKRALAEEPPEALSVAAYEFVNGPLRENPWRVGEPLEEPFAGLHTARRGTYRIIHRIRPDKDLAEIRSIRHRRDVHRA
ncbi:type II toxin-antitoxin system RelE/ParE family toxin [Nocardiopsis sp. CC223A]|uniref:type II toxin-antitoxin system RelE family toxin n=1 Tax=Nocardiopsis sp. CC223A TaxID=3044051 RepID=UPI00278C0E83|nr:type II toxin-antitoxin system RelE/ParE family toxin [Nocardiopsis sp. CC223A]